MIYEFYSAKRDWLRERIESGMNNRIIKMTFKDDVILSEGPFTDAKIKWSFFNESFETQKGLFLIPENGISVYLQKKSFENPTDIREILKEMKKN